MREYQIKSKKFSMPHCVYMQAIWAVRDYERIKTINENSKNNGNYVKQIAAIEDALGMIPAEYRRGLLNNIIKHDRYEDTAHEVTWRRWKQRFLFYVATNLGIND